MKLKLHWQEKYEVVREFPSFELSNEEYTELELEIMDIYNARSTETGDRAEPIFEMVEPYSFDLYQDAKVYPITEEIGSLVITSEEEEE